MPRLFLPLHDRRLPQNDIDRHEKSVRQVAKDGRLGRVGAKWAGDGTLEIGLLNGNVGKRWDPIGI